MDPNQENSQSPSQDSSSSNVQRTQFLDSLGLGDDLLDLTETRPERKAETDDGLVLSSQPDDVELPGAEPSGETVTSMMMTSTSRMYEGLTSELEKIDEKSSPGSEATNITVDTGKPDPASEEAPPLDSPVWMDEAPELPGLFDAVEDELDEEMPPPLEPLPLPANETPAEKPISKMPEEAPVSAEPILEKPEEKAPAAPAISPEPIASITLPASPAPKSEPAVEAAPVVSPKPEVAEEAAPKPVAETPAEEKSEPTPEVSKPELSEPVAKAIEDPTPEAATAEATTEPEPESPQAESEEEEVIPLTCPSCEGELVLMKEHLGLEGACVWCQTPIVAAASGVDGGVRVFPLMTPAAAPAAEQAPAPEPVEKAEPEPTPEPVELETAPDPIDAEIPAPEVTAEETTPVVAEAPVETAAETPSLETPVRETAPKTEPAPEEVAEHECNTPSIELGALPMAALQEEATSPTPEAAQAEETPVTAVEENASPLIDLAPLSPAAEVPTESAPAEEAPVEEVEKPESVASKIVLPESLPTTHNDVIPNISQDTAPVGEPTAKDDLVADEPVEAMVEALTPESSIDAPPSELTGKPLAEEPEGIVAASPFESTPAPAPDPAPANPPMEAAAPNETPVEAMTPTPWGKPEPQAAPQEEAPVQAAATAVPPSQQETISDGDNSPLEDISSGFNTPTPWGKPTDAEPAAQSEPAIASIDEAPKTIAEPAPEAKPPVQVGDLTYVAEIEEIPEEPAETDSASSTAETPVEAPVSEPFAAASAFPAPVEKKSESAGSPIENQGFAIPAVTNSESVFGELEISEEAEPPSPEIEEAAPEEAPAEPAAEEKIATPEIETPAVSESEEASHSVTSCGPPSAETTAPSPMAAAAGTESSSALPEKREEESTTFASSFAPPGEENKPAESPMTQPSETNDSVPPLFDSPSLSPEEDAGTSNPSPAGTPNVTTFSMSDSAPKKKTSKSIVVLAVILTGFVFGGALATFVLPVDDYVKMAREYMEKKFETGSVLPPGITTETLGSLEAFQASGIEEN